MGILELFGLHGVAFGAEIVVASGAAISLDAGGVGSARGADSVETSAQAWIVRSVANPTVPEGVGYERMVARATD